MKKLLLLALSAIMILSVVGFAACKNKGNKVTISFDKEEYILARYDDITLNAAVVGSTEKVLWESSDTSIATVDGDGKVIGLSAGSVTVTASIGKTTASCRVTVAVGSEIPSLSVGVTSLSVSVGQTFPLTATSNYLGEPLAPDFTFSSSNDAVAVVSQAGVITGVSAGTAVITAAMEYRGYTDSVDIAVAVKANLFMQLSETKLELTVIELNPSDIAQKEVLVSSLTLEGVDIPTPSIVWTSNDESVATVSNGVIKAVAAGSARVKASYVSADNPDLAVDGFVDVTVVKAQGASTEKISVDLYWDYGEASISNYMPFAVPSDLSITIDDITDIYMGESSVGDKNGLLKAACTKGEYEIALHTNAAIYTVAVDVAQSLLMLTSNNINVTMGDGVERVLQENLAQYGGKTDVVKLTGKSELSEDMFNNRALFSRTQEHDYMLVDIRVEQLFTFGFILNWGSNTRATFVNGAVSIASWITLYDEDKNQIIDGVTTGEWATAVIDLSFWADDGKDIMMICIGAGGEGKDLYVANARYMTKQIYEKSGYKPGIKLTSFEWEMAKTTNSYRWIDRTTHKDKSGVAITCKSEDALNSRADIPDGIANSNGFDYLLVDVLVEELFEFGFFLSWSPDSALVSAMRIAADGTVPQGNYISVYDSSGNKLTSISGHLGEWITLALNLDTAREVDWANGNKLLALSVRALDKKLYLSKVTYVTDKVFDQMFPSPL